MENLNYLDVILGAVVVLSALIGLARGLVKEVLSLIAWAVAIYVAWKFAEPVADDYIRQFIDDSLISYLAAFGALFIVVLFVVGLCNLIISQLLTTTGLSGFDRFLGMLFGLARGVVIGALLVFVIGLTPLTKESWWQTSRLQPGFAGIGEWGWAKLPADIRQLLRDGGENVAEAGSRLSIEEGNIEAIDQSGLADRPELRASGEQRNAISELGETPLHLESLGSESASEPVERAEPEQAQPENAPSMPPLQLESVQ